MIELGKVVVKIKTPQDLTQKASEKRRIRSQNHYSRNSNATSAINSRASLCKTVVVFFAKTVTTMGCQTTLKASALSVLKTTSDAPIYETKTK